MGLVLGQIYGFEGTFALYVFVAGFCGLLLLAAMLVRLNMMQVFMGGALLFAAITASVTGDRTEYLPTLLLPLQVHRAELHMAAGILLTAVVVFTGRVQFQNSSVAAWFMLAIALYAGLLQFIHDTPEIAVQSIGFALATIPCMAFATAQGGLTYEGAVKTIRMLMVVSVLWTAGSSVEFVRNAANVVTPGGRFFGLTANPQHAAVLCAPFAVCALWLILNDPQKRLKILWITMFAVNLLFLAWTGSRTGFGTFIIGLSFVLYRRMGQAVIMLPVMGGVLLGLAFLADELGITSSIERMVSLENTRGGLMDKAADAISRNPWIGVGWNESGYSENSYLIGFSGYGIGMFMLIISFLLYAMFKGMKLWFSASKFPKAERPLIDLYVGYMAMYFAGAAFEGYMLGRSAPPQVYMLIMSGLAVGLSRRLWAYENGETPGDDNAEAAAAEYTDTTIDPYSAAAYGREQ